MPEPSSASTEGQADGPPFPVAPGVLDVLETLWSAGHAAFLVGGGVRDALLGLKVLDWDVATDARPERLLQIFPGSSYQNRFGTVLAQGHEITTFRRDHRYADHRRPDAVTFSSDVFEDLARRDLTINAIAWGRRGLGESAQLVDPADGQKDLEAQLVRAVGDPDRRFDEDALRLLRAVRIAARLGFRIEPATWAAIVAHADDLRWVSEERVGDEIRRMLSAAHPSRALRLMHEAGLLKTPLPELEALPPSAQARSLATLDAAAEVAPGQEHLALAGLLLEVGPEAARAALERLRVGGRDIDAVAVLTEAAAVPVAPDASDADVRRFMARVPRELRDELLILRSARARALKEDDRSAEARELELRGRVMAQRDASSPLTLADLAIDGTDVRETLGVPEGPIIGAVLRQLLAEVIEDPALNSRSTLLTRASLVLDEIMQRGLDAQGSNPDGPPARPSGRLAP
ncbi:MAG: tRNA cytidylyltransferase [Chloroflexota bacterium]